MKHGLNSTILYFDLRGTREGDSVRDSQDMAYALYAEGFHVGPTTRELVMVNLVWYKRRCGPDASAA